MNKILLIILFTLSFCSVVAQNNDRDYIRMGNRSFRAEQYDEAETSYLKALSKKPSYEVFYNLGNTYLLQGKDSIGLANLMNADSLGTSNQLKRAKTYHNLGNVWYAQGASLLKSNQDATPAFKKAVEYYKSSLRCNPDDDETRYNLAKALFQLKKNQQNSSNNSSGGQNDEKKDEKQKQEKKEEEKKPQQQPQQPQQQEKKEDNQMSKQAVEQLLNSAQQDEKRVQRKLNQQNGNRKSLEKDW